MKYLGLALVILGAIGSLASVDYTMFVQYYDSIDKSLYYPSLAATLVGILMFIFGGKE